MFSNNDFLKKCEKYYLTLHLLFWNKLFPAFNTKLQRKYVGQFMSECVMIFCTKMLNILRETVRKHVPSMEINVTIK